MRLRFVVAGLVVAATFVVGVTSATAMGTLDQSNSSSSAGGGAGFNTQALAQTFKAGLTGLLDTVQVKLCNFANPDDLVVKIEGTQTDALVNPPVQVPDDSNVLATQSVPPSSVGPDCANNEYGDVTVPFDIPASIQAGTVYALVVSSPASSGSDGYSMPLTLDDYAGGQFCDHFGTTWDCVSVDMNFATFVTVPPPAPSADVALGMSGPTAAKKGTQVTYVITVSNAGPSVAHNVVLNDPMPAGASFKAVSSTKGGCTHPRVGDSKGTISCSLGDLASGGSVGGTVSIKITAKAGSNIANLVSAYSTTDNSGPATADPDMSNNIASVSTNVTK